MKLEFEYGFKSYWWAVSTASAASDDGDDDDGMMVVMLNAPRGWYNTSRDRERENNPLLSSIYKVQSVKLNCISTSFY